MLIYPEINPVIFSFGPLKVHWYGLMYLLGFFFAWRIALARSKSSKSPVCQNQVEDLIIYSAFGIILGGRFGYVLFYNFEEWLADPLWLFRIWEGGMSFHGGLLGVLFVIWIFSRKINKPFLALADFVAPLVPIGLGLGRLGNFMGQELWGRPTSSWMGMIFPNDPQKLTRHPSQLYEFFLEGLLLYIILITISRKPRSTGFIGGLFLTLYGSFRFFVELYRAPDVTIGFDFFGWMTRGQLLSLPMIIIGIIIILWSYSIMNQVNKSIEKGSKN
ncbi:MAG: prolipoprotein diacylglyceryl transferase [Cellvibrionales bacterium]|mgnify:FL=1|jgi:phosphatidylglycerol---prolipoprotein diacylglyceryl transferase|nr:prolipoprotein diacylglyceryl transferase [Cellvibrionales bacterium]MBT7438069.1 prolipoprotein diacylglyceryl transferase [Cellvibrionales bacterium]MDA7737381.1 prolipoprotein diacylglyceryl transferase [Porticoccus sp.]MDC0887641.1 prolipoprotein diacylglyceryl transferase [Porticoccus sp.]MDC1270262.1 prolipoprotein diacylglyceryl transferase [Porticoccus sp.]